MRCLGPMKQRIRFSVAYKGTAFSGWQKQPHTDKTVQQTLEQGLEKIFQEKISLFASGRTDAGVHARAQVCHFDTEKTLEWLQKRDWAWALKGLVPPSIVIRKFQLAPEEFHATRSVSLKTYRYYILNRAEKSPFLADTSWWVRDPLSLELLNRLSQEMVGEHDFRSFQSVGTPIVNTVRSIYSAAWQKKGNLLRFTVSGDGFLKQMVRNMVGTIVGLQPLPEEKALTALKLIMSARDRQRAGAPAPPMGLFLWKAEYPQFLDKQCRPLYHQEST